jgi:hypothetical protein
MISGMSLDENGIPVYAHREIPRGKRLLLAVEGEHGSELTLELLEHLGAVLLASPRMPLVPGSIQFDCLVAPPERGGAHFEVLQITV